MNNISIDLDNELVKYIKEKCDRDITQDIETIINIALEEKNIKDQNVSISISAVGKDEIHQINKEYRNVDKETDVLSFPIFEKEELDKKIAQKDFEYEDILGDIIISIKKVEEQAKEYGHSFERELAYMIVHGFYHLMGYDHIKEEDKLVMRPKEEKVLERLGITREEIDEK